MDVYKIPISGIIGDRPKDDLINEYFSFTDFLIHVKNAKEYPVIKLELNTPGGDVDTADKIIEVINELKKKKTLIAENSGDVMSAGVTILLSVDKSNRFYNPENGLFLAHFPWGIVEGEASEIEEYYKMLKKLEQRYVKMYADLTGTDEEIMRGIMAQNIELTAEQVEQLGFAIVIKKEKLKAVAMFNNNNKKMDNELKEKLSAIEAFMLKVSTYFKPKSLVLADTNGVELDFGSEITDVSQILPGVKATVAGAPAQGEYILADGSILVFDTGELKEIKQPMSDDIEEMRKENEALKAEIETLKASSKEAIEKAQAEKEQIKSEFEGVKNEFVEFKNKFNKIAPQMNVPAEKKEETKKFTFKRK